MYFYIFNIVVFAILGFFVPVFEFGSLIELKRNYSQAGGNQNCTKYVAGVVEYKPIPIGNQSASDALLNNVNAYVQLIEDASHSNVDIIVFPEYGITTIQLPSQREKAREYLVDVPDNGIAPCDDIHTFTQNANGKILYELSCAARTHRMYVVVNLGELENCSHNVTDKNCPADGAYHFNTNVAFNRNGTVIAKYRKYHLYFEQQFDYPQLEFVTFQTDFCVEFGMFTCFDILFANPAVQMIEDKGVRNFVFPTAWVDELPFLTAIQAQAMWAQSNKANLLASGYHQPDRGSMGSGIYSGNIHGALEYVFDKDSGTKLIVSTLPISSDVKVDLKGRKKQPDPKKSHIAINETNHFWLREDLSNCSHKKIDLNSNRASLCYDNFFCCDVEYQVASVSDYLGEMKLIVFDGKRTVAAKRDWFEWQVCAIVHCLNETLESCTENISVYLNETIVSQFESLTIRMTPLKLEYQSHVSQPSLSLLDTSFNLIPQTYFEVSHGQDLDNGVFYAHATTKNSSNIADTQIKTVALIQKIYGGRV